jgi:hypothetical protein
MGVGNCSNLSKRNKPNTLPHHNAQYRNYAEQTYSGYIYTLCAAVAGDSLSHYTWQMESSASALTTSS